jgi:carbon storage regulator CsrA
MVLVLSRNIGRQIIIDGNIEITVLQISGNKVRLGISAPASITVDRVEILPLTTRPLTIQPDIDQQETFQKLAEKAKAGCPVSKLLHAEISLDATLGSANQ